MTEAKKGPGRPTSFKPEFVERVKAYCEQGLTDYEIARILDVAYSTLRKWRGEHPEFSAALKAGKEIADRRVEHSLYHRAIGYSFDSEEIRVLKEGDVVRVPIVEHVPPDTTAAIFWLKNRQPDLWRDKQQLEHTGKDGGPVVIASDKQRARALASFVARTKVKRD